MCPTNTTFRKTFADCYFVFLEQTIDFRARILGANVLDIAFPNK